MKKLLAAVNLPQVGGSLWPLLGVLTNLLLIRASQVGAIAMIDADEERGQ